MLEWKKSVNKCVGTQRITHILDYCIPSSNEYSAPIDNFYTALNDILRYCANPDVLENNLFLGPLMFTGIMSATENYIREILVSVLKICPISRAKASNQSICFGSVIWQGKDEIEKGAFENVSFADSSTIKKTLFNYLNINIKQSDLVFVQLEEFESICQIRHAVVHSNNILAGKNATKLEIPSQSKSIRIKIDYGHLQECASVCTALVTSINTLIFEEIIQRWAIQWRSSIGWDSTKENKLFNKIWDIFYSKIDEINITKIKCRNAIKKEYHID